MNKCDCYIEDRELVDYTPLMKPIYKTVARCNGTRERDKCSCCGDRTKCDFYPEVRKKALNEQENNITKNSDDSLIVTYDCCHSDGPTLCIARKEKDRVRILNAIQGDVAFGMYHYLTGGAELKNKEIIRCRDCDVPHNKWTGCPKLNGLVTPPDFYCAFAESKDK